jgi:hypothetical protein
VGDGVTVLLVNLLLSDLTDGEAFDFFTAEYGKGHSLHLMALLVLVQHIM